MEYYVCPICKTKNDEHQKYCPKCGTWLLSSTFPAIKVSTVSKRAKSIIPIALIIIIGLIGYLGYSKSNVETIKFGDIEVDGFYKVSQLIVDPKKPSAIADFIIYTPTIDPLEVTIVFYDDSNARLGKASTLISNQLQVGQITTINFDFDESNFSKKIANARIEVVPLSPLMLIERMANKTKEIDMSGK